jgi:predicted MFS family arabinose efflux permease
LVFLGHQFGGFTGAYLGGLIFDLTGSYDMMWSICIAASAFAALMHIPISDAPSRPLAQPA